MDVQSCAQQTNGFRGKKGRTSGIHPVQTGRFILSFKVTELGLSTVAAALGWLCQCKPVKSRGLTRISSVSLGVPKRGFPLSGSTSARLPPYFFRVIFVVNFRFGCCGCWLVGALVLLSSPPSDRSPPMQWSTLPERALM